MSITNKIGDVKDRLTGVPNKDVNPDNGVPGKLLYEYYENGWKVMVYEGSIVSSKDLIKIEPPEGINTKIPNYDNRYSSNKSCIIS